MKHHASSNAGTEVALGGAALLTWNLLEMLATAGLHLSRRAVGLCILLLLVGFSSSTALALQTVTLAWNPSTSPDIAGYNVYYGTASRDYTQKVAVTNGTTVTISGLVEGRTYYFAVTAFDLAGLESVPSNEVSYTVPEMQFRIAPVASSGSPGTLRLTTSGMLSYPWVLQSTTNLQTWRTLASGTNEAVDISVSNSSAPAQFFRIVPQ